MDQRLTDVPVVGETEGEIAQMQLVFQAVSSLRVEEKAQ
jgi:hypothetical protein